jgi:hypothetical protein
MKIGKVSITRGWADAGADAERASSAHLLNFLSPELSFLRN